MTVSSLGLRVSTNSCLRWTKFDLERSRSRTRIRNNNHHNSKWCKWCCTTTTSTHWGIASQHSHSLGWQSSMIDIQIFLALVNAIKATSSKSLHPQPPIDWEHQLVSSKKIKGHRDDMGWPWSAKAHFDSGEKLLHLEWATVAQTSQP